MSAPMQYKLPPYAVHVTVLGGLALVPFALYYTRFTGNDSFTGDVYRALLVAGLFAAFSLALPVFNLTEPVKQALELYVGHIVIGVALFVGAGSVMIVYHTLSGDHQPGDFNFAHQGAFMVLLGIWALLAAGRVYMKTDDYRKRFEEG